MTTKFPVVVIGAGPIGLAAAAHLAQRGLTPLILEAGDRAGAGMQRWSHVRMFSPWAYAVDATAAALLHADGWQQPDPQQFPTGGELVAHYLAPLARTPALAPHLRLGARVTAVTKVGVDRLKNAQRDNTPFLVRYVDARGEHDVLAHAVIDASGTTDRPNPLGAAGIAALGEAAAHEHVFYGVPDVLGAQRPLYAGKRVLVVGSGHSALNALSDLARLAQQAPATRITWALRRPNLQRVFGGGDNDQLQERGRLGMLVADLVERGALRVVTGFRVERIVAVADGWVAQGQGRMLDSVDEIIAATGFRPNLDMLGELRLNLDPTTQSPAALAPLIDPNHHSCGSVRPHGAVELAHPDANFYIVGMKSYGRAPTFLLLTGYEQVRSVVAAIAGDWDAARRVELVLPETGVCITQFADETVAAPEHVACCGGPALHDASACCRTDEAAKASGSAGCGCSAAQQELRADVRCCA